MADRGQALVQSGPRRQRMSHGCRKVTLNPVSSGALNVLKKGFSHMALLSSDAGEIKQSRLAP
jgi:hypothetical protein